MHTEPAETRSVGSPEAGYTIQAVVNTDVCAGN